MLTKQQLLNSIEGLPENFTVEEVIDRIILLSKIETGLEQIERGEVLTTEQAKDRLKKWLE